MQFHDDQLLSEGDLAPVRGVPVSRLQKERLRGEGPPFIKDGHLVRYRWGDYRGWLQEQRRFTSTSQVSVAA